MIQLAKNYLLHRCLSQRLMKLSLTMRSEEHTSELQSRGHIVCRLLLEKKKKEKRELFKGEIIKKKTYEGAKIKEKKKYKHLHMIDREKKKPHEGKTTTKQRQTTKTTKS